MGYNFSTKDLLNYEKQMVRRITEQQLEAVSGGVSAKNWALGGIFSLMALGAGIVGTTNSASAELTTQDVAKSTEVMETAIAKKFETPKILPTQDEKEIEEVKKDKETSQSSVDESVHKKDIPAVNTEQTVAETPGSGTEQSTADGSGLRTEQTVSDISDLETAQTATKVDSEEVFETRQLLTDEQQLYVYEALNLQEAYALLKSGIVENVRFYGNIMEIETENGVRHYTADKGDAFTELLYMLYPSPTGDLNTNTNFKGRDSFAMYGGMSSELVAKFFAILNDCRNNKIEIPKEFKNITLRGKAGQNSFGYVNPEFKKALDWLKVKGLLTAEDLKKVEDDIKKAERLKSNVDGTDINRLRDKLKYAESGLKNKENIVEYFNKEKRKLTGFIERQHNSENNGTRILKEKLEDIGELEGLTQIDLKNVESSLRNQIETYKSKLKELNSTVESIERSGISKKAKFLMHFINTMKKSTELEVTDDSSYPKYLTEHILMSYMYQTLNGSEDVRELYQKIAEQLSQNKTNKIPTSEERKETTVIKIASKKEELARLNDIINVAETQGLSPYKSATQSNGTTFKIGLLDSDGKVQIQPDTFADCADIAVRHVVNFLTFANKQNWDLILKDANMEDLNTKLREVVDAINRNEKVKFYDLKTRLQMSFLYQRGFIEGVDNEEDIEYRSKNGSDDVTPLARTLWEYVICNMNEENLKNGQDKDKGLYPIVYVYGKNHEIETGYINMLKLMWNMAKALDLESEALSSAKSKIDALSERVKYDSTMFEEDSTAFEEALSSIFSLFYTGGKIEFTLSDCKYVNNEITGDITVDITKDDQNLNFTICHYSGHGETKHNPVNFNVYNYLENYWRYETLSDFGKLLLRSFMNGSFVRGRITPPVGFYGTFSEEDLTLEDAFRNTNLYKKYKAFSAFMDLQDEENNGSRINGVLDIDTMRGAKNVAVKQKIKGVDGKQQVTKENLSDVFYRKFLKPHGKYRDNYPNIDNSMHFYDFGEIEQTYFNKECKEEQKNISFDVIKTSEKGEVLLLIKNVPENCELIIPSTVYDKEGTEYKVTRISKYSNTIFENLKMIKFTGNFDNLTIGRPFIFRECPSLKTFKIQGNVENLTIRVGAFSFCNALENFAIQGNVGNLTIEVSAFSGCEALEIFAIQGNVGNLTIEESAFNICKALKIFAIQGNVENLNFESRMLYNFSKAKIFLPENLKNKIPKNFRDKNKIIFYDITDDDTLHLKVNEAVSEISLDKETLETLGENFQKLKAMDLKGNTVKIKFDDDLKGEFLEVEDKTGLYYERKRA